MRIKRALKIGGAVLVILVAIPVVTLAITFSGLASIADGKELTGGVRIVKDSIVSAAVVPAGEGAVALVDCGNDAGAGPVVAELKRRGLGPEAVRWILVTHGHSDHVGGCKAFPKAEIYALATEIPLLEGKASARSPVGKLVGAKDSGIRVTHPLQDGEAFQVGPLAATAYAIPGHTEGSAAYFVGGIVYLGDAADATSDGKVAGSKWLFSESRDLDRQSLRHLAEALAPRADEVKWLVFSHSAPLEGFAPLKAFASGGTGS